MTLHELRQIVARQQRCRYCHRWFVREHLNARYCSPQCQLDQRAQVWRDTDGAFLDNKELPLDRLLVLR